MPAIAAAKFALVLALFAPPAIAQQPTGRVQLPPGYRPRTPPPTRPIAAPMPVRSAVVQASDTSRGVPTIAPIPIPSLPPALPPAVPALPTVPVPQDIATAPTAQPEPAFQPGKNDFFKPKPVHPDEIKLPPRAAIFMVYNDLELERAIIDRIIQDLIIGFEKQIKELTEQKKDTRELEKNLKELRAIKLPARDVRYQFPPLPVVSPPGMPYLPKTLAYEPRTLLIEPGYVMHRRLHFEERNAERQGWDLGPLQTLVSAGHFYRDVLLWPHSLASGCVHGFWDTSAGKCLPGSPTPYYLYPPGLTITGTVAEGTVITGAAILFP